MALTLSLVSTLKKTPKNNYHIILIDDKNQPISGLPADLNEAVNQLITVSCFQGKLGATALAYANEPQDGLLLVGIGTRTQPQVGQLQKIAKAIYNQLSQLTKSATLILADYYDDNAFGQLALALLNQSYVFDCYKSKKADDAKLTEIVLFSDLSDARKVTRKLESAEQRYGYQVYDWVIPLRNMKSTPKS